MEKDTRYENICFRTLVKMANDSKERMDAIPSFGEASEGLQKRKRAVEGFLTRIESIPKSVRAMQPEKWFDLISCQIKKPHDSRTNFSFISVQSY